MDMSYAYRPEFMEHLMEVKGELFKELSQMVIAEENKEDDEDSVGGNKYVDSDASDERIATESDNILSNRQNFDP